MFALKKETQSIYTLTFAKLCLSSLLFSASYNMLIPELPAYLATMGGSRYIGLIIALFTLTAGLSRPFSGILTDKVGRKPVMIFGALVCIVCGLLYPILGTVAGFLFLRLFHGFSTGFTPTAVVTYVADIVPKTRWGEAFGVQGLFFTSGLALGPAIGSTIKLAFSYDILFYSSSVMALLSVLLVGSLRETLVQKERFVWKMLRISLRDILAKEVFTPALLTFLAYLAFGMALTLIPDWSDHLGIRNRGSFFLSYTVSSILIRILAGKLSDTLGRRKMALVGLLILTLALVFMGLYASAIGLMITASLYGLAMGILSPTLSAWTIDLSFEARRGKAVATRFIALEAGIGLGALGSGWWYQDRYEAIPQIMMACAFMVFVGFLYTFFLKKKS
ncbi:MFS transporter [Flagellimonas sp. DF-77]|uniref:MFS transporter n=1 Tax=Flagellimonas algarum TaxID=3230298 RepID=UPI00339264C1